MRAGSRWWLAAAAVSAVAAGAGLFYVAGREDDPAAVAVQLPGATGSSGPPDPAPSGSTPPSPAPSPAAPSSASASSGRGGSSKPATLYTDASGLAAQAVRDAVRAGDGTAVALLRKISERPTAVWFADSSPTGVSRAKSLATRAATAGELPVLALYNIPHRDCSGESAGGASGAGEYRSWIDAMAAALAGRAALIVLEPDAVAQAVQGCLDDTGRAERYELLSYAVGRLGENDGLEVYLDAGNPTWITDPEQLSGALRLAGVDRAAGFSLNVANFEATDTNISYGTQLSDRLGGSHFVIDTSRNGNGPAARGPVGNEHWCNPAGRRLGEVPTLATGHELVDAYLWVKRPGESDGACGNGAPQAGQWYADYAMELAK